MKIHDNGKGFKVGNDVFFSNKSKRLGLLGMRERAEMVGGSFSVKSTPGKETSIFVEIHLHVSEPWTSPGGATKKQAPKTQ